MSSHVDPAEQETAPIRNGYGHGLLSIGDTHPDVVVLDADLGRSTRGAWFGDEYPERWFNIGIAEQDMIVTAAGLASTGKTAFAGTFATFSLRGAEQVRNAIARPELNVIVVGSHGGVATGPDGASAQAVEDIAVYRSIPNMTVISPGDAVEAAAYVRRLAEQDGPAYLRLVREPTPILFDQSHEPAIGQGTVLREGADVAILTHGAALHRALGAQEALASNGIDARVVHLPTIKPLDEALVLEAAAETGQLVTVEDHSVIGGLGGAVAELIGDRTDVPLTRVGIDDTFGESGDPDMLYRKHGLTADAIQTRITEIL